MLYVLDRPCWSPAIMSMEAATGERIVAFGRAGKSPENPFFRHFAGTFDGRRTAESAVFRNGF